MEEKQEKCYIEQYFFCELRVKQWGDTEIFNGTMLIENYCRGCKV